MTKLISNAIGAMLLLTLPSYAMEQEQRNVGFLQLPNEIQEYILSYCIDQGIKSLQPLIQLSRVNKGWRTAINNETTIKSLIKETSTNQINQRLAGHWTELYVAKKMKKMPGAQSAAMRKWYATEQVDELLAGELQKAITNNNLDIISVILERGYPINKIMLQIVGLQQPLFYAVSGGKMPCIEFLINAGADVNGRSYKGYTPLMIAANGCLDVNGNSQEELFLEIVKLLVEKGADLNAQSRDGNGDTAVIFATYHRHKNILELLLYAGANPNVKSERYGFALDYAISKNDPALIELLRKHGALGLQDYNELMRAAKDGDENSIATLITKKININAQERITGETPLMRAAYYGHLLIVNLLLAHKVLLDIQDNEGCTALTHTVLAKRRDMVERLLLAGAYPRVRTKQHASPAELAQRDGRDDIAVLLAQYGGLD